MVAVAAVVVALSCCVAQNQLGTTNVDDCYSQAVHEQLRLLKQNHNHDHASTATRQRNK